MKGLSGGVLSTLLRTEQALNAHLSNDARHVYPSTAPSVLESVKVEELSGAMDGVNLVFTSTYVPINTATLKPVLVQRGGAHIPGGRVFTSQSGVTWILAEAPVIGGDWPDERPWGLYIRDPAAIVVPFDPSTMYARRRIRRVTVTRRPWWPRVGPPVI